jgi:hypothetical protein
MVILEVPGQEPPEMSLVQDDHDEALHIGILPRIRGAITTSSIPMLRTRCRNEAP